MGLEDEARFEDWMAAHVGVLHRIARAFAAGADQQDLMQELMLAVWRAAPKFRGDSAPSTFIFRVAHNTALTWRRRETVRRRHAADYERLWVEDGGSSEPLLDALYAAIRRLEMLDRSLMLLALEGLSYGEIGAIHGLSESNVGVRLTRARKKLGELMEGGDEL